MKKMMKALGCAAMAAIVGCSDAQESAESIGIIGGNDGPTATWMTTRLVPSPGLVLRAKWGFDRADRHFTNWTS